MIRNGENGCFRCVLHQFRVCYDLQIEFQKQSIFCDFRIFDLWVLVIRPSKFRPPGRISADWYYFRKKYDHISLPSVFRLIQRPRNMSFNVLSKSSSKVDFLTHFSFVDISFSQHLLTSKISSSKSLRSGECFEYPEYINICCGSTNIQHFLKKSAL